MDQKAFLQIVIAHEVAHQWWYSIVGNDVLLDPWQDEALATYSTLDFLEKNANPIYQVVIQQYRERVSSYEKEHPNEPVAQPISAFQGRESAYATVVYLKGALFFNDVRQKIGDKAFYQGLSTYYRQNSYHLAAPGQLLKAFQDSCGCNLSALYQQWGVQKSNP
jgi:aminopeptidase N